MSDPYIGQIYLVGYNFAQRGFAFCNGTLIAINQNSALFSLLGTTFGGDGRTTFGLPDLRGRTAIGLGRGPGLPDYRWGQRGGADQTTLNITNMPSHNHTVTLNATSNPGSSTNPTNALLGSATVYAPSGSPTRPMAPQATTVANNGGGQAFNNMQPYLALNYEIALTGIFPSRS